MTLGRKAPLEATLTFTTCGGRMGTGKAPIKLRKRQNEPLRIGLDTNPVHPTERNTRRINERD
jgi:hypothetical protein